MDLQVIRARAQRNNPTVAEQKLWRCLRGKQLGVKFRRQHPLGPYVLDFFCPAVGLAIELDGGQHAGSPEDVRRDQWLAEQGIRVVRFWNRDVLGNMDGVLERILSEINKEDPPYPPL